MRTKILIRWLLALSIVAPVSSGQSSSSSAGAGNSGSSNAGEPSAQSAPAPIGFSIETEMLTYKSLEANSEAIACDIARRLLNGEIGPSSPTAPCTVKSGESPDVGVVIISSPSTVLPDFQLWRADLATMNALELEASRFACPSEPPKANQGQSRGLTPAELTPAGQILPLAQSVLGMFARTETISPVTGTVHDQALMNAVARQLKELGISVLIPDIYGPFSLGGADSSNSPFLSSLARLVETRGCLEGKKDSTPSVSKSVADEIGGVITSIDSFIGTTTGGSSSPGGPADTTSGRTPPPPASNTAPIGSVTHIASVLTADGLARAIGVKLDGTADPNPTWQHVLWLKALESGGTVAKEGSIFGNKIRFSGGAVSTYALFSFNGDLDCSGNVFDYEGSVLTKDFSTVFRQQIKDPSSQLAFMRGGCTERK